MGMHTVRQPWNLESVRRDKVTPVLVIGNGESRKGIDIPPLRNDFILIGCNAIHRDTTVDHLVCCDRRMAEEATDNPNTQDTLIYVRDDWFNYFRKIKKNKNVRYVPNLPYQGDQKQDKPDNWGSGCYAILLATTLSNEISILGFDLYGTNNRVNNVYKNTSNYSKEESNAVDPSYWIYQIGKIFSYHPNITFTVINKPDWIMPREWQYNNVKFQPASL